MCDKWFLPVSRLTEFIQTVRGKADFVCDYCPASAFCNQLAQPDACHAVLKAWIRSEIENDPFDHDRDDHPCY